MIILLLCIPMVVLGAKIDAKIDWTKCEDKTKCFMPEKCKDPSAGDSLTEYPTDTEKNDGTTYPSCRTGFQNYVFSEDVILFQIQAEGKIAAANGELAVYHGDKLVVGCKTDENGKLDDKPLADPKFEKLHPIAFFEERSAFGTDRAFCSITLKNMFDFESSMRKLAGDDWKSKKASIRYISQERETIAFELPTLHRYAFYKGEVEHCNPFLFQIGGERDDFHVLPIPDIDRDTLDCTYYKPLKYKLWSNREGELTELESLTCNAATHLYDMKIAVKADTVPLVDAAKYEFHCAVNINRICKDPVIEGTIFGPGTDATAATLKCPENKWLIDKQYYKLEDAENPICKQDDITNMPIFFIPLESGEEIPLSGSTNASCFTDYDCSIKSSLEYSDCKTGEGCGVLDLSNGRMKCEDPKFKLSVQQPNAPNVTLNATEYYCEASTGEWTAGRIVLQEGARVYCDSEAETTEQESELDGTDWTTIAIGFAVATILLIANIVFIYFYIRGRRVRKIKGVKKEKWMKMDTVSRAKYAHTTFDDLTSASVHLVNGLDVLEMLLDTNTEDPEVWEEVYPFLLRMKSAMNKIDHHLAHLFTRYMYLRAKKIIDEHGWISQTRITKSNPTGLMRAVAIRLLAHCAFGKHDSDAMKLIEAGFRRLGFDAVEQYPHCGMMWALASALSDTYLHPDDALKKDIRFDVEAFTKRLYTRIKKPPLELAEADIIPQFGSISDQAMFALGALDKPEVHRQLIHKTFGGSQKGTRAEATKLLEGMAGSMSDDPGPRIFVPTVNIHPENKEKVEKELKNANKEGAKGFVAFHEMARQIAPADVWNALTKAMMKIMVYAQHSQDAKRLSSQMMPEEPQPSEYYMTLRSSQEQFVKAVEGQTMELWLWLTRRTDLEELKQRPVLLKYTPADPKKRVPTKVADTTDSNRACLEKLRLTTIEPLADAATPAAAAPAATPPAAPAVAPSSDPAPTPAAPASV